MPQTNSAASSVDCQAWLDDSGGELRNISGSTTRVRPNKTQTEGRFATGESSWQGMLSGFLDADLELEIVYSEGRDEALQLLKEWWFADVPGLRTIELYIPDFVDGCDVYFGEVRIRALNYPMAYNVADPIMVVASVAVSGVWNETTYIATGYMLTEAGDYMLTEDGYRMVWEEAV